MISPRRSVSSLLVLAATLASTCALLTFFVLRTFADPSATRSAATAVLSDRSVHEDLIGRLDTAFAGPEPLRSLPPETLAQVRTVLFADPQFTDAVAGTLANAQSSVVSGTDHPTSFDITEMTRRAMDRSSVDPQLAAQLAPSSLRVSLAADDLPDLSGPVGLVRTFGRLAFIVALGCWAAAFLLAKDRAVPLRSFGRFVAATALAVLAWTWLVPALARRAGGTWAAVPASVIDAYATPYRVGAFVALFVGVLALLVARSLPEPRR